jgi:hypothetical protein
LSWVGLLERSPIFKRSCKAKPWKTFGITRFTCYDVAKLSVSGK